jgi:putative permease
MKNERRIKVLQYLGIFVLALLALKYINELFGTQVDVLFYSINIIVLPFSIALFISYLLSPLMSLLEKRVKIKNRMVIVLIVFAIMIVVLLAFGYFVGKLIYDQALIFIDRDWDNIISFIEGYVEDNDGFSTIYDWLSQYITFDNASPILINVFNIFRSLTSIVLITILVPVFLFFLLHDKKRIFKGILSTVPEKFQPHVEELGKRGNVVIEKYFNGRFISMFIMSIFYTILFLILGFKERSVFFGFMLGFLDIVPYVGPFIGTLLPFLFSFTVSDDLLFLEYSWIAVLAINGIGQLLQGNLIQPWIMGKEVDMHPLLVLVSFIFFGALFGITGVILAIPITGIIRTTHRYLKEIGGLDALLDGVPKKS